MPLARRSRVVETGGASPADVVVTWRGLSPWTRLTLESAPVGYSGVAAFSSASLRLLISRGLRGRRAEWPFGKEPTVEIVYERVAGMMSARRSSRWRYAPRVTDACNAASRCASSTPTIERWSRWWPGGEVQGCDRARRMPRSVRDQPSGACQELPRPITLVQRTAIRALVETWLRGVGLCGGKAVRGPPRGRTRGDRTVPRRGQVPEPWETGTWKPCGS
jgi:hypothetical protein